MSNLMQSFERCAQCDGELEPGEWHPVEQRRTDGGAVELHSFCSDACHGEWTTAN